MNVLIIDCDRDRRHALAVRFREFISITVHDRREVFLNETDDGKPGRSTTGTVWVNIDPYDLVMLHIGGNQFNKAFYLENSINFEGMLVGYTGVNKPDWFKGSYFLERVGGGKYAADFFYIEAFCDHWEIHNRLNFNILRTGKEKGDEDAYALLNNLGQCMAAYLSLLRNDAPGESSPVHIPGELKVERLFRPSNKRLPAYKDYDGSANGPDKVGWYWFDYAVENIAGKSFGSLKQDIPELNQCPNLETVYNIIWGECLNKAGGLSLNEACKGWMQVDYTNLFRKAHQEYLNLCEKHSCMDKLDNFRENLNHNELVNDFLDVIGNSRQDKSFEDKYQRMLDLWKYIKKGEKDFVGEEGRILKEKELAALKDRMEKGLNRWWELEQEINAFFTHSPGKYHFQGTPKLQEAREKVKGWCEVMGNTVRRFLDIHELPEDEKAMKAELTCFWEAALKLKEILNEMKISRQFDSYFQYILE
jgi:hypothetical protein